MRSRTSRGVLEWSRGKELYMGSHISVVGNVQGVIGIVPGQPKGFRGPPRGSTCLGGPHGLKVEGSHPLGGLVCLPRGPMRLGLGETLRGAPPLGLGASSPQGRRPPDGIP
jgi:hypothetical protein